MVSRPELRRIFRSPVVMVVVALAIRLAVMGLMYGEKKPITRALFTLPSEMARVASSIASGEGFASPLPDPTGPTAWVVPVYAYLLAGVFRVFGVYTAASAVAILTINSLFSALTCLPIHTLARKSFGPTVATAAGWTWVVFPYAVYTPVHWIWEACLATLLLTLLILLAVRLDEAPSLGSWVGFGALWGVAALTNPAILAVLPFLGAWICFRLNRRGARWAGPAGAAALVFVLCVTPWFVRNYRTFGRFIPFRSGFALELRVGNSPEPDVQWRNWLHPNESQSEMQKMRRLGEIRYMDEKWREALQFIASHPGLFLWLTLKRILYVWTGIWSLAPDYLLAEALDTVNIPFCTAVSVLAFAGLRRAFRQGNTHASLYGVLLFSVPLLFYVTHSNIRYRHPMDPYLILLATFAVVEISTKRDEISAAPLRRMEWEEAAR